MAIFTVTDDAFHGHPEPIAGNSSTKRYALQLVYYTKEKGPLVRNENKISDKFKRKIKTFKFPHSAIFQPNCHRKSNLIGDCEKHVQPMFSKVKGADTRGCECVVR